MASPEYAANPAPLLFQRAADWTVLYILKPLAQILVFIVGSAVVMSVLAIVVALIFRNPRPGIDLLNQVFVQLPNMILDGITIGFVYAMIALGYTMVYGVLKFINFAHSEIFMVGGVVGYEVMSVLRDAKLLRDFPPVLLVIVMVVSAMVICGLLAFVIERLAYKPLRNAPRLVPLISAIGVSFFLQDFIRAIEALHRNEFNLAYPSSEVPFLKQIWPVTIGSASTMSININSIIVIIGAILMVVGLNYFVNATKFGKGIRAVSQDQATAALMGINVNLMISLTFVIGGALGGAAGVLFGLKTTNITPYVGFIPGLKAFTAAVLGGIGNITGALLGGLLLGLLESFFAALLPYFPALGTGYRDIFAFAVLILILIFRPSGLLGQRVDEKV
jgi:branched-chain amino acid transport system permease protein